MMDLSIDENHLEDRRGTRRRALRPDEKDPMNPRRLLTLAFGAGLLGHSALLLAQPSSGGMRRVGLLAPSTRAKEEVTLKPFFDQMRDLGWIEGRNIMYDWALAEDQHERLPRLASELAARKPELIYAPPTAAALAAKRATASIPIVFASVFDPVGSGLIASFAHPDSNITGICYFGESLVPKRVELLRVILPEAKRIGLLGDSTDPATKLDQQALSPLAASLGLTVIVADAANQAAVEAAIARFADERVDAIVTSGSSPVTFNMRERAIELANQRHLPLIGGVPPMAAAGALFSYGASLTDQLRRSALLVDKILKGAKPGDLPVEQPTLFEFVVNLKAAKTLGITIPQAILLRADRVIE